MTTTSASPQPVQGELDFVGVRQEQQDADTKPEPPKPPEQTGGYRGSQFLPKKAAVALKETFGLTKLDEELEEMLKNSAARNTAGGLNIDLPSGSTLTASDSFIGIGMSDEMQPADAKAIIGIAKSRGWTEVSVNRQATEAQKDMMWLEAQRQGIPVKNYEPDPDSKAAKAWRQEQLNHGVSQADNEDYHKKTMLLLKGKADAEQDPAMKAGLNKMLKRFTDGAVTGDANTFAALSNALSDQHKGREGFNLAVDALSKTDPQLGVSKIEDPAATTTGQRPPTPRTSNTGVRAPG
ncbi:MAG: LPD7 domain-containing protein [Alphaproteobacteria bacterium]